MCIYMCVFRWVCKSVHTYGGRSQRWMSLSATLCPSPFEMVSLTESALARLTPWISRDTVSRWQAHTTSHGFLCGYWGSEVRPSGCYWVFIQQALYCLSCVPVPVGNGFLKYYIFIHLFCVHVSVCIWKYCAVAGVQRKEDNLQEWVLSFYSVSSGDQTHYQAW